MTCFFLGTKVTPNVWLMTAFCTGSICRRHIEVRGHQPAQDGMSSDDRVMLTEWQVSSSQSVWTAAGSYNTHTRSHTVLKFGKSPTGDVVSTGNGRNGFIITEGPVAPMRPGNAPPTALHPLPGNRETESLNGWLRISGGDWQVCSISNKEGDIWCDCRHWVAEQVSNKVSGSADCWHTSLDFLCALADRSNQVNSSEPFSCVAVQSG